MVEGSLADARTQPGSVKTVADTLTAAADLIEPEGKWTQGHAARAADGTGTGPEKSDAVCWCAWGAIAKAASGPVAESEAFEALRQSLGLPDDTDPALFGEGWNDAPERTQAEVVAALRAAADKARTPASESAVGMSPKGECAQSSPDNPKEMG